MNKKIEANMPEKTFRSGLVTASVWNNISKPENGIGKPYKTISFQRRYCTKTGVWKSTRTLRISDLPKAAIVLEAAFKHLVLH